MVIPIIAILIRALWLIAEWRHSLSHKTESADLDKLSRTIWSAATFVGIVGVIVSFTNLGRIEKEFSYLPLSGIILMLVGLAIRWNAIFTLGDYFTRTVTIKKGHQLIRTGLYQHLRHPSYTGALLAQFGLALALSNWLSFILIFVPLLPAALYRMRVEEDALLNAFGVEYIEYVKNTKRLIPKVY
jgi:protein-S-isoprenylcysteine O-methyltransferase Ste14